MQGAAYKGSSAEGIASGKALHLSGYDPQRPKEKPKESRIQLRELKGVSILCGTTPWFSSGKPDSDRTFTRDFIYPNIKKQFLQLQPLLSTRAKHIAGL